MNLIGRLAEIITIVGGVMGWWLAKDVGAKSIFAGVAITAIVSAVVYELRSKFRRKQATAEVASPDRALTFDEVMTEDARELLRIDRERQQKSNDVWRENARKKQGLDRS